MTKRYSASPLDLPVILCPEDKVLCQVQSDFLASGAKTPGGEGQSKRSRMRQDVYT